MLETITKSVISNSDVGDIIEKSLNGEDLDLRDAEMLFRSNDIQLLGLGADTIRRDLIGDTVTFISNLILNYTNICIVKCKFCAFYRDVGNAEGYNLSIETIGERAEKAYRDLGVRQVLIQGGVNPEFPIEYYEEAFRAIKSRTNGVAVHGLSTSEIEFIARKEKMSIKEVLERLKEAGLDSLPGAGGEILVDKVRKALNRNLSLTDGWLKVMEEAHKIGLPTSSTMVYGHIETAEDKAKHLMLINELQKKTGGFMSFIPWNMEIENTQMSREGMVNRRAGGSELLKSLAVARLVFRDRIKNIQTGWLTNGISLAQLALTYGANDWGGTIYDEEVIPATGKKVGNLKAQTIIKSVKSMGRPVAERDNFYSVVKTFD